MKIFWTVDIEWEYGVWLWMRISWTVDYGWEYGVNHEWEYGVDNEWEYVGLQIMDANMV